MIEAKRVLKHGSFLRFLRDTRVGIKPRAAQLLIKIASAEDGRMLARYGIAKASLLLRLSPEARKCLIQNHDVSQLSVTQLRVLISAAAGRNSQSKGATERKTHPQAGYQREFDEGFRSGPGTPWQLGWAAGVLHIKTPALSTNAIEGAFRKLVQILHPDKGRTKDGNLIRDIYEARQQLLAHVRKTRVAA